MLHLTELDQLKRTVNAECESRKQSLKQYDKCEANSILRKNTNDKEQNDSCNHNNQYDPALLFPDLLLILN